MKTLTMDRQGQFYVETYGRNHCGRDTYLPINYRLICECETKLDGRGFLFDQINVDNYFQEVRRTSLSCEKLTIKCVRDLIKMIKAENPICEVRRMKLTLSPSPFKASMTYRWKA